MRRKFGCPTHWRLWERGTTIYLDGVTAAPVYHHHLHWPEEFDTMPADMEGKACAVLETLKTGLNVVSVTFANIVTVNRYVADLSDQDSLNRVWAEYFGDNKSAMTTVQVVQLTTDPRCLLEIKAVEVADCPDGEVIAYRS